MPFSAVDTPLSALQLTAVTSPGPSTSSSPAPNRKKGPNWTKEENEQLVKSWLEISQDPIIGDEQKADVFWEHATTSVAAGMGIRMHRDWNSLQTCWQVIQSFVNKFCGCFA